MLRLACPFCGLRDEIEFRYRGDAGVRHPEGGAGEAGALAAVYERDNPRGAHREWWHHNHGCRRWLVVTRDTLTHAVISVTEADSAAARTSPSSPSESGSALRAEPDSGKQS
jgi:sarcosine oxidase subunit delta